MNSERNDINTTEIQRWATPEKKAKATAVINTAERIGKKESKRGTPKPKNANSDTF